MCTPVIESAETGDSRSPRPQMHAPRTATPILDAHDLPAPTGAQLHHVARWIREHAWYLSAQWSEATRTQLPDDTRISEPFLRFGEIPAFIAALAHAIDRLAAGRSVDVYRDPDLQSAATQHARHRIAAGFERRDLLDEFVLLRDVLWVAMHATFGHLAPEAERTVNRAIDAVMVATADEFFVQMTDDLARRADHDALTGLLNRQAFRDRVKLEIARAQRHGRQVTLVTLDLDAFKEVNDSRGHLAGDAVLQRIGDLLRAHTRDEDVVGRLGGDEFAVALLEADERAAHELVRRIQIHLAPARRQFDLPPAFGVSFGTATFPDNGVDVDGLLHDADHNLYASKGPGRSITAPHNDDGSPAPQLGRLRVLVADDDPAVRTLCAGILESSGFELDIAIDGEATIAQALRCPPDVLLLDLRMPKADGWTVLEALAGDPRTADVPVVMMTGFEDHDVLERATQAGIIDFVSKPFDPERLVSSVHRVLEWSAVAMAS